MARKSGSGEVNKSQAIRDLLKENPKIKAREVVDTLAQQGIVIKTGLVYMVKGKMSQKRSQARKEQRAADRVATGGSDAVKTIRKVKALAEEVGGLGSLKAIVDLLSE